MSAIAPALQEYFTQRLIGQRQASPHTVTAYRDCFRLLFAYLVRFLALALNAVEAGLGKINRNLDDAARILGRSPGGTLARVHVPLIWSSVLTAVILVFVDVLKELPATLILRPFNFETLAVRVYRFAADERLAEASTAALAIVVVGLIPVILLSRAIARARPHGPPA